VAVDTEAMKKFDGINYGFRPVSYWGDTTVQQAILRGVKGTLRRKGITTALANGELEKVGEDLLSAELTHAVRTRVGRIHPAFLGGEYLPSFESTETEIARIELQSTTYDVISIRASLGPERIHYRVVDEYGECFQVKPATSRRAFTLQQLVRFIDDVRHPDLSGPFSLSYNKLNAEYYEKRRELRYFTYIGSDLYPQLSAHYAQVFEEWVQEGEWEDEENAATE
jgi:hypothetical protein